MRLTRLIPLFLVSIPLWFGCSGPNSGGSASPVASGVAGSISAPFLITKISPDIAGPGEDITISGQGLTAASNGVIFIFGGVTAKVSNPSDTQVKVTVPDGTPGIIDLVIKSGTFTLTSNFFRLAPKTGPQLILADVSLVCKPVQYYDVHGTLLTGTRDCGENISVKTCSQDHVAAYDASVNGFVCLSATDVLKTAGDPKKLLDLLSNKFPASTVASRDAIACAKANQGQLIYSKADAAFYFCDSLSWSPIDLRGAGGSKGVVGDTGSQGTEGSYTVKDADSNVLGLFLGVLNPFDDSDHTSVMVQKDSISYIISNNGDLVGPSSDFFPGARIHTDIPSNSLYAAQYYSDSDCTIANSVFIFSGLPSIIGLAFSFDGNAYQMNGLNSAVRSAYSPVFEDCQKLHGLPLPQRNTDYIYGMDLPTQMLSDSTGGQHVIYADTHNEYYTYNYFYYTECFSECNKQSSWSTPVLVYSSENQVGFSATIDADNTIHMIVDDDESTYYGHCTAGTCASGSTFADSFAFAIDEGGESSLLVTPDYIYIITTVEDSTLYYSFCDRGAAAEGHYPCTVEGEFTSPYDIYEGQISNTSLASDGSKLYLSFQEYVDDVGRLKFASCDLSHGEHCSCGGWTTSGVIDDDYITDYSSLIANSGNLYVSYYTDDNEVLKFASCTPGDGNANCTGEAAWATLEIDSQSSNGWLNSLAVDPATGNLHLAYYSDYNEGSLNYVTCTPVANPSTDTNTDTGTSTGTDTGTGTDSGAAANGNCTNSAANWSTPLVIDDINYYTGQFPSVFVDSSNINVSYFDAENDIVKYTYCPLSKDCTQRDNWIPVDGYFYDNSFDAVQSLIPLNFSVPLEFLKN